MVVYLHEALDRKLAAGIPLRHEDIEAAAIEGAVQRLRPKLMTVCAVLASLIPILWETGIGSDVMKPIAAPIVGGMITSTIHVFNSRARILCADEGTSAQAWYVAAIG
jgi:Cu(I)/Ag(I) efflux system membrane protein CusA/SilA